MLFVREDWTEFRDITRLPAKAGVRKQLLPRVAVKELVDNALDAASEVTFGRLPSEADEFRFFVSDGGEGIRGNDQELAAFFTIRRPLTSSKTRRMPTRGMLGNGLRVVVGVVLVGDGELSVATGGRRLTLRPTDDGRSEIVQTEPWDGSGTRIEVTLREEMAILAIRDSDVFRWANEAQAMALLGETFLGSSSPWWYGGDAFWELLQAAGATPVEKVVAVLDGCTAKPKIRAIAGDLWGREGSGVSKAEAQAVLGRARDHSKPVRPERLGCVGEREVYHGYSIQRGEYHRDGAQVPFVLEVWANRAKEAEVTVCVNRTPIVTDVSCYRVDGMDYVLSGAGLKRQFPIGQKSGGDYRLVVNLTAPFVPLTSSGKDPDLRPVAEEIIEACQRAAKRCRKASPKGEGRVSQKAVILSELPSAVERLVDGGNIFSLRQLFYAIRPALIAAICREPDYNHFARVIGEHEDENGEVEGLYRDDRGTLYHPHTGESIPLGTRSVAGYRRPAWGFNKILYCEKEGFFPILQRAKWPERHDCALLTSKGFASRAARDVMRLMGETGEDITFFCIHDADGAGTVIYDSLREALEPAGVRVVNLGLDPEEGQEMGLQAEPVQRREKKNGDPARIPVGSYVSAAGRKWLQSHRIELNAMSTSRFLEWLSRKLSEHDTGKVRPPADVVRDWLRTAVRKGLAEALTAAALREARVEERVDSILAGYSSEIVRRGDELVSDLGWLLDAEPTEHWTDMVHDEAGDLATRWAV